jgi:hypothetical protein
VNVAPKRQSVPIIVFAGRDIKEYLAWGLAAVAAMVLHCPVCGARLIGDGWRARLAKSKSRSYEPEPARILVHELVCPGCRRAGRRPHHFRVLPSFLCPFKHFIQSVRLAVFDRAWQVGVPPVAIEAETGVDRWLIRVWLHAALGVLAGALPDLAAQILRFGGRLPVVTAEACLWERWWSLGLALRAAMAGVDPSLGEVSASVLEWLTVLGARRRRWWALAP